MKEMEEMSKKNIMKKGMVGLICVVLALGNVCNCYAGTGSIVTTADKSYYVSKYTHSEPGHNLYMTAYAHQEPKTGGKEKITTTSHRTVGEYQSVSVSGSVMSGYQYTYIYSFVEVDGELSSSLRYDVPET